MKLPRIDWATRNNRYLTRDALVNQALSCLGALALARGGVGTAEDAPKPSAAPLVPQERLLSGGDWKIACFEPGQGIPRRAFAEGFPAAGAIPATVPGDVHWDLERAGKLPNVYERTNSSAVFHVPAREWWYRKVFPLGEEWRGKDLRLRFDAVDYAAKVWLNGTYLGAHEGQFTPFEFDVTQAANPGESNVLSVLIQPAPESALQFLASGKHGPFHEEVTRTMTFWKSRVVSGWDFGVPLWSAGIWQDVRLIGSRGVAIREVLVFPETRSPYDRARVKTKVKVSPQGLRDCDLVYRVRCVTAEGPEIKGRHHARLDGEEMVVEFPVDIQHPRLWWPHGYGDPNLYELEVAAMDGETGELLDAMAVRFGVRDLQILPNPASENRRYQDYWHDGPKDAPVTGWRSGVKEVPGDKAQKYLISINGRRIFARGANLLPTDMMFGRSGRAEYEHLIRMAAMGNHNVFRIWGGGLIEKQVFYDLCDRYGIMVWQEMPHAGAMPSESPEVLANTAAQQRQVMGLLINHPCIVRYGFGNELYTTRHNSSQIAQFEDLCGEIDPTRPCYAADPVCEAQRHAPWYFSFPPGGVGSDGNPEGWPDAYAIYNTGRHLHAGPVDPIEWTEYGASGLSSVRTLKRIIPAGSLWPVGENAYWHHHHAPPTGWWLMSQIYRPLFGDLADLDTEVRVSQFAQAEGLRYANQAHRRHKWHRSACVSWTFNEPWPNAAHGCIVEYYGLPKMAYYYARNAYAEVDVSAEYGALYLRSGEPLGMKLSVTSERKEILKKSVVTAQVVDLDGGVVGRQEWPVDVPAGENAKVGEVMFIPGLDMEGKVVLVVVELHDSEGGRLASHAYTFGVIGSDKEKPIPKGYMNQLLTATKTDLAISAAPATTRDWYGRKATTCLVTVRNAGKTPALFVKMDTDGEDDKAVYFEDNYFTLLAGETRQVNVFMPDQDRRRAPGTRQVHAEAWNSKSVKSLLKAYEKRDR